MAGSILASSIDKEYRIKLAFTKDYIKQCNLSIDKQCNKCKYKFSCRLASDNKGSEGYGRR